MTMSNTSGRKPASTPPSAANPVDLYRCAPSQGRCGEAYPAFKYGTIDELTFSLMESSHSRFGFSFGFVESFTCFVIVSRTAATERLRC